MHAGDSAQRQKSYPNVLPAQIGPYLPRACWLKGFTRAYTFHSPFGNPSHPPPCPAAPSLAHPPPFLAASKINFQQEQQVLSHLGLLAASPARKQLSLFAVNQPPSFSAIRSRPSPQPPSCKREEEGLVLDQRDLLLRSHGVTRSQSVSLSGVAGSGLAGLGQPDISHRPLPHLWGRTDALISRQSTVKGRLERCHIHRETLLLTSATG